MIMNSKAAFHTLGCKLNFSETSAVSSQFKLDGFDIVDFNSVADVYIINTCSVTENAEKECRQIVRRALRNNPNAFIAVTGCYAQLRPEDISRIEGVDAILGSNEKFKILELFENFNKREHSCIQVTPTEELDSFNSSFAADSSGRTRAFFKIQDGCDYTCTYCTIPLARGKSRSLEVDNVMSEFTQILENGYKEIILTGVNVGDYGQNTDQSFYDLLSRMVGVDGDFRIRISSIEPNLLTDEILELVAENDKICKHFHIPLQSGNSKILKLMQRRYSAEYYNDLILKAKERIIDLAIGVDVIVGFPGETYDDFLLTYNFLKDLPISYLHVFTYSERPNTKAIEMDGIVDVAERKKRNNMLRILSEKKKYEFYNNMIDKNVNILFENENHDDYLYGWTSNYVRVKHPYSVDLINTFIQTKIERLDDNICTVSHFTEPVTKIAG
jgi:threonylcarbamoyladenosine tRNA methylthiotransferase MtaB